MSQLICVTITGPDETWLANHTRQLVEKKLAACGNITTGVRSVYAWQGSIEDDSEAKVTLHTQNVHLQKIIEYTNEKHPYDIAQIVAVEMSGVDPKYEQWVISETQSGQ